jgi:hypothetical protein
MSSFINSEEFQVFDGFQRSSSLVTNVPISVVSSLEISFAIPFNRVSPSFTSSPVANKVFVSRVNENIVVSVEEISDLWRKTCHPVAKKSSMDNLIAFFPRSSFNTENFKN